MPIVHGQEVGPIGYGLMGLTWYPTTQSTDDEKIAVMKAALEAGATAWNGGVFYGTPENNSLTLMNKYFTKYPEDVKRVKSINIKGGMRPPFTLDNSPEYTRESVENSIALLGGKARINLWEMARRVTQREYLDSLRVLDGFVKEGKIDGVSLSEINANTIRQAVKITKVAAVEVEISLAQHEVLGNGVAEACAEFGIPIFAYCPLGSGLLTGKYKRPEDFVEGSFAAIRPALSEPESFANNMKLVEKIEEWAAKKGCTPAQFAINWVASLSRRPGMPVIIPIPGGSRVERVQENLKIVELTDKDMDEVDAFLKTYERTGEWLVDHAKASLDTTNTTEI